MHGAGNDYVLVDGADVETSGISAGTLSRLAQAISDRHTGVGSDGLIVVRRSPRAAARMEMYNADGSRSAMCGNGLRLVARFIYERSGSPGPEFFLESDAGIHRVKVKDFTKPSFISTISIIEPEFRAASIPLSGNHGGTLERGLIHLEFATPGGIRRGACVSMGNPHCVIFVDDVARHPVIEEGSKMERDPRFPERTNIEFTEIRSDGSLLERTFERGAGETMSCGSGACAAAVVAILTGRAVSPVRVRQAGGELEVSWTPGESVLLTGPADVAFRGEWLIR